jgi:hypothetical protein
MILKDAQKFGAVIQIDSGHQAASSAAYGQTGFPAPGCPSRFRDHEPQAFFDQRSQSSVLPGRPRLRIFKQAFFKSHSGSEVHTFPEVIMADIWTYRHE